MTMLFASKSNREKQSLAHSHRTGLFLGCSSLRSTGSQRNVWGFTAGGLWCRLTDVLTGRRTNLVELSESHDAMLLAVSAQHHHAAVPCPALLHANALPGRHESFMSWLSEEF
ncbi:hypothetical protein JYU34_015283 [Plutella xylostella]|uniref:Uncharacterized protein n=1 Tax=Plutella xylostella TaxID=51655 RepID=A0ABQ7Q7R4_PLUXY|nr:hypothetical protein JYU34_015283 [Plutella xylostella]